MGGQLFEKYGYLGQKKHTQIHRTPYKRADIQFYNLLVLSATSKKATSTMAVVAMNAENIGQVPHGHGALLYCHCVNLSENEKKDPQYERESEAAFYKTKMKANQAPLQWRQFFIPLWNKCKGKITDYDFVNHFIINSTEKYDTVKDKYAVRTK